MFEYYPLTGQVTSMNDNDAQQLMDKIAARWNEDDHPFGKLFTIAYNWDVQISPDSTDILIPYLKEGGSATKNQNASNKCGFDVYGDCFIKN